MRSAHGTEMRCLGAFLRQCLVVKRSSSLRIETQIKLILPAKLEARLAQCIIADLRTRVSFGQVGGVRGNFVSDHSLLHIFPVWQAEMLFWCHVTEHRRTVPSDHRGTNRARQMIISGR